MIGPETLFGLISPAFAAHRAYQERRRHVRLTMHRAFDLQTGQENWYVTVTNLSPKRDVVITHAWIKTQPRRDILDPDLPRRLKPDDTFEMPVPVGGLPADAPHVAWRGRVRISSGKTINSRPSKNIPPIGTVPRGGT